MYKHMAWETEYKQSMLFPNTTVVMGVNWVAFNAVYSASAGTL